MMIKELRMNNGGNYQETISIIQIQLVINS